MAPLKKSASNTCALRRKPPGRNQNEITLAMSSKSSANLRGETSRAMTEQKSSGREQRAGGKRRSRQGFARIATCLRFQRSRGGVLVFFFCVAHRRMQRENHMLKMPTAAKRRRLLLCSIFYKIARKWLFFYKQPPKMACGFYA
jgi:hypothetical protein